MLLSHLHTTHFHSTFANIQGALPSSSDTTGGANPLLAFQMLLVLKANSLRGWEPNIIGDYQRKKRQLLNSTKRYKTLRANVTPFTIIWWPKECDVGRRRTYVGPIPYLLKPLPWSWAHFNLYMSSSLLDSACILLRARCKGRCRSICGCKEI